VVPMIWRKHDHSNMDAALSVVNSQSGN